MNTHIHAKFIIYYRNSEIYSLIIILLYLLVYLLQYGYLDFIGIIPYLIYFIGIWSYFIYTTHSDVSIKSLPTDVISNKSVVAKSHYSAYIDYAILCLCCLLITTKVGYLHERSFFFSQLYFSSFSESMNFIVITIVLFLLFITKHLKRENAVINSDFFFCVTNIVLWLSLLWHAKNILALIFLIEVVSFLTFYMFVVSNPCPVKTESLVNSKKQSKSFLPKGYINMIFFNYWATFFSSILLFYSLINMHFIFCSSEIDLVSFLMNSQKKNLDHFSSYIVMTLLCFLVGFFIKIGMTPIHLFKIEVYKGLPLITLLFYTTFFFFVYMNYFSYLMLSAMIYIKYYLSGIIFFFCFMGMFYVVILMFNINAIKAFFAYSTVINTVLFVSLSFCS